MPTVPADLVPSVGAEGLPGRPYPHVDTDVSAQNFGSGLAAGIEDVGAAGAQAEAKIKEQNDHLRVIDANTQLEAAQNSMLYGAPQGDGTRTGGAFSLHGAAAINMPATLMPQYEQVAANINSTLTPDQQQLFAQHIANGRQQLNLQLSRYEYEEGNRLATETFKNSVAQSVENASVGWRDPMALGKSRLDIKSAIDIQADREGWTDDQRQVETNKALAEMHFNVIDRMLADGSPGAALKYFKDIRDTQELTGQQAHQLGATIDSALNQNKAQNQTALLAQMRDASTAAINGLNIPPSQLPSRAAVLAAFPEDGERRWQALQGDISMGATLKSLSTLSATDIQKAVDGAKPTSVSGAADQFERYNMLAGAASKILAQRNADPRQALIDNKMGSAPLDFSSMDNVATELKSRLASTQTDSERFGRYVPPLSSQEASQFAQRLQTMTAMDRAKTLAALNTGLQNDRGFQTVMHQIIPGSPVTAIVGSQLNQASPQNTPVWMDQRFMPDPSDRVRTLAGDALINPQGLEKGGTPKIKLPPEETSASGVSGLRSKFAEYVGNTFANRPDLGEATYAAFKANYAQQLAESGKLDGSQYDPKLGDAALKATVGHTASFNGQTLAVPPGLDPARFQSIVNAAVAARAKMTGLDPAAIKGFRLEEVGGLGSGRYQLLNGNALVVNPGGRTFPGDAQDGSGRGLMQIDIRNQYLPSKGVQPTEVDARRTAEQTPAVMPTESGAVPGTAPKTKEGLEREPTFKAPPVTGLSRGGGKGKAHPSQGAPEAE